MKIFISFVLLLVSMPMLCYGQSNELKKIAERNRRTKKSTKIDQTKPAVYVDFVKIGEADPDYSSESEEGIYLKLVNNSRWSIYADFFYRNEEKRGVAYTVEKEVAEELVDQELPTGPQLGHCCYGSTELKSGKSVSFNIPRNHLAKNLMIRIKFDFEWELDFDGPEQIQILYPSIKSSIIFRSTELDKFLASEKTKK